MATTYPTPIRRHLSPSAEMRVGEQMRVRLGMIFASVLTFGAMAAVLFILR
ncbi:MAG TPA: hypothetical protein VFX49_23075 [Chloroflexota bacterium]|nr:hypothetical protein [Chloroflexota bacterium]